MTPGWREVSFEHPNHSGPLMLVQSIDRSIRVCMNIRDLIHQLHQLATTFDLIEGNNQVEMLETHKSLCAFVIDWELFEPNVKFQLKMNEVLGE